MNEIIFNENLLWKQEIKKSRIGCLIRINNFTNKKLILSSSK